MNDLNDEAALHICTDIKKRARQGVTEGETYVIISKEVVGDEPLQLLSHPASWVHDVAVPLSQVPDLLQC